MAHPVSLLIRGIYDHETRNIASGTKPSHTLVELLASLERALCFCHTGNTSVLAATLMHPLGLSKGIIEDGFPVLLRLFEKPTILSATKHGFKIDPQKWPLKDQYPAVASKRAQILTYSVAHFMVRFLHFLHPGEKCDL